MNVRRLTLAIAALHAIANATDVVAELNVQPANVSLSRELDQTQLVITARDSAGRMADVTDTASITPSSNGLVQVHPGGRLTPLGNGTGQLVVRFGSESLVVPIAVTNRKSPIDFDSEVVAVLSKAGCNAGTCHGSPSGKNGFRLSLRGLDPNFDHRVLTRSLNGRRVNVQQPESSLLLQKADGRLPHGGGRRLRTTQRAYRLVREWIAHGAAPGTASSNPVVAIRVHPQKRALRVDERRQQLRVEAVYQNGRTADVTDSSGHRP